MDDDRAPPGPPSPRGVAKRTVRAQMSDGSRQARAYAEVHGAPAPGDHKTFEMRTVAVDDEADPRRRATVARGLGEAVASIEGDIVDPHTGEVLPAPGIAAGPSSPWREGKRPTKLRGAAPPLRVPPPAGGVTRTPGSQPSTLAWALAGAVIALGIVGALVVARVAGRSSPSPAPSAQPASAPAPSSPAPSSPAPSSPTPAAR